MAAATRPRRAKAGTLKRAVSDSLENLPTEPQDAALRQLAAIYAETIDGLAADERGRLLGQLGPGLLRVLEALQSTPHARATLAGRKDVAPPAPAEQAKPPEATELERLRAERASKGPRRRAAR